MDIILTIIASIISGIVGSLLTIHYYLKAEQRNIKYRCLSNIMKNLNALAPTCNDINRKIELCANLNEAFIAFSDNKEILLELEMAKDQMNTRKLTRIILLMCDDLKIDHSQITDEFITKPFC